MSSATNPFKTFLDHDTNPSKPDFYGVFQLDPKSATQDQIVAAAKSVIGRVRAQETKSNTKELNSFVRLLIRAKDKMLERAAASTSKTSTPKTSASTKNKAQPHATKSHATKSQADPAAQPTGVNTYAPPTVPAQKKTTAEKKAAAEKKATQPQVAKSKQGSAKQPSTPPKREKVAGKKETSSGQSTSAPDIASAALPPKAKKTSTGAPQSAAQKNSKQNPAKRPSSSVQPGAEKHSTNSTNQSAADDTSFNLDAPDQNDSFDSETHLSTNYFKPGSVTVPTVDPMAPVPDPTEAWQDFDLSLLDQMGSGGGVGLATMEKTTTQTASQPVAAAVAEKTYYSQSYRAKSKAALFIGGTLLAMLIVGGISYAIIFGFGGKDDQEVAQEDGQANDATKSKPDDPGQGSASEKTNQNIANNAPKKDDELQPKDNKGDEPTEKDDDSMKTEPKMSDDENLDPKKIDPTTPDPNKATTATEPKKTPDVTEMKKEVPMKLPEPKNSEIAQLATLLTGIKAKLGERDMVEANRLLEKAAELPMLPDHKLKLDRLKQLADLYGTFWNKVVEGCGKLKALDEIKFSDTNIVKVVESSEERIVYRALGQRFDKSPRELQIGLALKIAEKELDPAEAEFRMIKGAVFAIDATNNPDRADQAKVLWEEAKLLGGQTDELILYLDDSYDLLTGVIKKAKIPEEAEIKAAQDTFREKYKTELQTASRNQKTASAFAQTLLNDVPTLDAAADRHANLVAAIYYAGKFGDVELAMNAISDMNKWFTIDLEAQTYEALVKMNKGRLKPDQKREIMRTAFEYMDRAKAASNQELELKFAELALAAARGTRDPKLIQTATGELQRVKASSTMPNSNN